MSVLKLKLLVPWPFGYRKPKSACTILTGETSTPSSIVGRTILPTPLQQCQQQTALSLLAEPGGSSKRPRSSLSSGSFRKFSPSPERFREDNRDSVMAEILHLLRHQQNPQPTVLYPGSVDVPGMDNAIVLLAVTIAGAGFQCRALHPFIPHNVIVPMAISKSCDVSSAPIMSASRGPAMTWAIDGAVWTNVPTAGSQAGGSGHVPSTPCEWNPAGGPAPAKHPGPEVNSLEYHVRHRAGHPEPEIISRNTAFGAGPGPSPRSLLARGYVRKSETVPASRNFPTLLGFSGTRVDLVTYRYRNPSVHFTAHRTIGPDEAFSASAGQFSFASANTVSYNFRTQTYQGNWACNPFPHVTTVNEARSINSYDSMFPSASSGLKPS